jgi:VanZ family protein
MLARGVWDRPPVAIALGLGAMLAADAFYPFAITLDVSTAMDNLRAARVRPLGSLARGFWPDLLVEKAAVGAALGAACRLALAPWLGRVAALGALACCAAFAVALEVGKLGFVGRSPNVDNALFVGAGALAGAVAIPWLQRPSLRGRAATWLVLVAAAALIYQELTPFDFTWSTRWARAKSARVEWLLFGSYYGADAQSALFDLAKKLGLGAFLGASMRAAGRRGALGWGLALGVVLEALQLFQRSHIPALTDALSIGAGAGLGAWAVSRHRARTEARPAIPVSNASH